jgi:hypothetical protein
MPPLRALAGRIVCLGIALSFSSAAGWGCSEESIHPVLPAPVKLASRQVKVVVDLEPFVAIQDVKLTASGGPARRVRRDVLRLP